jgi:hypothetical protein
MSDCGENGSTGLRPNLSCPPDLSQLLFRFIERKRLGVVKGRSELAGLDMSQFFLPLNGYFMSTFLVSAGETLRIESSSSMDFGKRREITSFDFADFPSAVLGAGATVDLVVKENGITLSTLANIVSTDFATFITNFKLALGADAILKLLIEYNTSDAVSIFTVRGKAAGKAYTYELKLNDTIVAIETLAGTVTQSALRYPRGAWKLLFLNILFCNKNRLANEQFIEWAYDSDVVANGESGATWRKSGPLYITTGAEDVTETDLNLLETIWLRNTTAYDTSIQAILGT